MFILKMGLQVLSPLSVLTILPSISRGAGKQCNIAELRGSDLSCHVTGPYAAGSLHYRLVLWHYTFSTLTLSQSRATPPCQPTQPTPCTDATALLANLHPGHGEGERRDQASLQGMWPSPVFLLYPLITIVLQSNFMYL